MVKYRNSVFSFFIVLILLFFPLNALKTTLVTSESQNHNKIMNDPITTVYNQYTPDGNCSILVALDSNLLGEENYFGTELIVQQIIKRWFKPFEDRFNLTFHVKNVTTFTPEKNDSLDASLGKVSEEISWRFAAGVDAENVEGNDYDWLFIYQENYQGGRNRANAIYGNALIIAHNQPIFDRQLIFLHEVGHIFGGAHDTEGNVNPSWYQGEELSIMDYEDLMALGNSWDGKSLPLDKHNFDTINSTKYRFDRKDPELDGLPNYYEYRYGFDPTVNDSYEDYDNDGLTNLEEYLCGTNPANKDSDRDGFSDWAENYLGTSPMNASEIPEVNIPVLIPWTKQKTINENEPFNLTWRGISSNPNFLEIYQNDSLLTHKDWENEFIQYTVEKPTLGFWNFTCLVVDKDGEKATSEMMIQVRSVNSTTVIILGPLLAVIWLVINQKNKKKR